ncbi:MAG TPA: alpha/beta hydrolase [Labilithrix sp.]|nr:alpha/beta hydrolase [Labilithrix sp.]
MQARDVSTRGARVRFVESSPASDGAAPPLVLVHDGVASHETFLATMEHLSSTFRVIAPDLPGFGASEKPDPQRYPYGYDGFADSVADLVAALGLGRVHVCGHAMGGGVALSLAARHPALVHKLVLVDALVYPADEHVLDRTGRVPLVGALLWSQVVGNALFRSYVEGTVYAGHQGVPAGRVDALYASFNSPAARQAAHASIVAKADTRSLVARLPRVTAESLVVWGRGDLLAPVEHGRRLARALKGRIEVVECGRCPPDEEPAAFAAIVASFLQSTPSCRTPSSRSLPHVP